MTESEMVLLSVTVKPMPTTLRLTLRDQATAVDEGGGCATVCSRRARPQRRGPPPGGGDLVRRERRGRGLAQELRSGRDRPSAYRLEPDDSAPHRVPVPKHRRQPLCILIVTMPPWPGPQEAEKAEGVWPVTAGAAADTGSASIVTETGARSRERREHQ